ncbi:MAG: beta-propeller domain-containing protein, partial [Cellvibrionales bacterium]|nr:beta-propeller domain-containing protein [Cellvibrionales bacterium]
LEIPGFSDYLHPIGKDQLLGIGKDAALGERNITYHLGVKVSLFDVSDITQPREVASKIIGRRGSNTELAYNHLAFTGIQTEDSYRFAFPITVHEGQSDDAYNKDKVSAWHDWLHTGLYLFEVKEGTMTSPGVIITEEKTEEKKYPEFYGENRGLIQGEHVYHLHGDKLYKAQWLNAQSAEGPF